MSTVYTKPMEEIPVPSGVAIKIRNVVPPVREPPAPRAFYGGADGSIRSGLQINGDRRGGL
jgi:hypothetical protein